MTINLGPGDYFPDIELPDHLNRRVKLSGFTKAGLFDRYLGFTDGYPLIVVFYRGFFCPRDQQQMRNLVQFQSELAVNFGKLVAISADPPQVAAAFRSGLGANWPFLSDEKREVIKSLNILDETEGEYAYRAQPFTLVLYPDLRIHSTYNGWYFVGRPTLDELRQDLRAVMQTRSDYRYEAYTSDSVRQVRIPQQEWLEGAPELGASGLPVHSGVVSWFDPGKGFGMINGDELPDQVFFHFTAIPGEGYRTIAPGSRVKFELVSGVAGLSARNIQSDGVL